MADNAFSSASDPPSSSSSVEPRPPLDPHNNGARAALTNEIRAEFFRLYEQSDFQIPGLSPQNILRHKDKDLHFTGHDGLRDFWKQTAATRREILQLARDNRIRVKRGPDALQPMPITPCSGSDESGPGSSTSGDSSRKRTATSSSSDDNGPYKRISMSINHAGFTPESTESVSSASTSDQGGSTYRASKMVQTIQAAIDEYGANGALAHTQGERIRALERERDEALRARDEALGIAEESYRELRAVVESRGKRIQDLKDERRED